MTPYQKVKMVKQIAHEYRNIKESEWIDATAPYGVCVETSETLILLLKKQSIEASLVEGWWIYDDKESHTNRPYDEHSLVCITIDQKPYYLDITGDQFQFYMDDSIPSVYLDTKPPNSFKITEPDYLIELD